jgi:hypothetical protein
MAALPLMDQGAHAAEAATGVYLHDDTYFYSGKISGTTLPTGGLSGFFLNSF